jgi:hypothetical protein
MPAMIGPDGLHMTDAGYSCLASELAKALVANLEARRETTHASPDGAGKFAEFGSSQSA